MIPSDISGLKLWLKATSLSLSDNDPIGTWADSSGLGNDATQGTEANKPTYKTNILNGKPVVRFDGGDSLTGTHGAISIPYTIFVLMQTTGNASGNQRAYGNVENVLVGPYGGNWQMYANGFVADGAVSLSEWKILIAKVDASPLKTLRVNGSASTSSTTGQNMNSSYGIGVGVGFGLTEFVTGDIAEVGVYDSAISDSDCLALEDYFTTQWLTAASGPSFRSNNLRPAFFKPGLAR